ncbi:YncE family protein [Geomonas sp.]|uniref:YncE family protein n=1 Tax=Geomonas sp. TaxID=2651584 RepID=UPI002B4815FE|nr:YncE family protein [Geomonas sp.]HJV36241.1 YncE family protein [Geomonas sp.]
MKSTHWFLMLLLLMGVAAFGLEKPGLVHHLGSWALPGSGGYVDYLVIGGPDHRLYAGYASEDALIVVDIVTGRSIARVGGLKDVRSIALVEGSDLGFTSNRGDGTVGVVDLKTNRLLRKIRDGKGPDAIIYDKAAGEVYVANHEGRSGTFIDPASGKITGIVPLGGLAEYAQADPATGLVYQNLEDKSEIVVVDPKKKAVVARYRTAPGKEPTGIALDPAHHRLFAACGNNKLVVVDATNGSVKAVLPIGSGVDSVAHDPALRRLYTANGAAGTMTVIRQESADKYAVIENLRTREGAHALAVDPATHRVYVVHGARIEVYDSLPDR